MMSLDAEVKKTLHAVLDSKASPVSFDAIWEKYSHEPASRKITKKTIFGIIIPSVILLGGGVAAAASFLSNYTQNLQSATHAQGVFEYVNGTPVSNEEFDSFKAGQELVAELNHQSFSETKTIQMFNQQQVLYQQAQKEGLTVSTQQARTYAEQVRQTLEHPSSAADKSNISQMMSILKAEEKGLGVSDQEYWTELAPMSYKMGLSIAKLKQEFYSKYQSEHQGATNLEIINAWNQYAERLLSQASIGKS